MLENTGELTVVAKTSAKNTTVDAGGKLIVQKEAKTDTTRLNNGGVLEVQDGGEAKHVEQQSGGALIASTTSEPLSKEPTVMVMLSTSGIQKLKM